MSFLNLKVKNAKKVIRDLIGQNICLSTRFSFYKNILYKNIEAEKRQKIKNILRIC